MSTIKEISTLLPIHLHHTTRGTEKENFNCNSYLQLSKIDISEDYRKKWNISLNDFVCLTKNGELIRDTLYRVGGFGVDIKNDYFMLMKHVEAFYSEDTMKNCKKIDKSYTPKREHLESQWCIIDKNGIEKKVFESFGHSAYLVKNSQVYSINSEYYNIETGEFYCRASTSMDSSDFLFLENRFDKDESRRGVMKINKKDGSWELFK